MRVYMMRRLLLAIPTVFLVSLIVFFMIRFIPGSAIDAAVVRMGMVGGEVDFSAARAKFEHALGLDVHPIVQYGRWIGVLPGADGRVSGLLQGDLGHSYWKATTVLEEIAVRWPVTLELGLMGLVVGQLIALPIGNPLCLAAGHLGGLRRPQLRHPLHLGPGILDRHGGDRVPGDLVGIHAANHARPVSRGSAAQYPHVHRAGDHPGNGHGRRQHAHDAHHDARGAAAGLRQNRLGEGLRERLVVLRHGLKNALIPVVTYVGLWLPVLIGGTVIIERIFALQGMGYLIVDATEFRDYPIMSGVMLLFGLGTVFINLLVDITYGFLQPRVQYN